MTNIIQSRHRENLVHLSVRTTTEIAFTSISKNMEVILWPLNVKYLRYIPSYYVTLDSGNW